MELHAIIPVRNLLTDCTDRVFGGALHAQTLHDVPVLSVFGEGLAYIHARSSKCSSFVSRFGHSITCIFLPSSLTQTGTYVRRGFAPKIQHDSRLASCGATLIIGSL
jgi:hypothetical protein